MRSIASQPHERTLAAASHLAAIPFPLAGPLVTLVVAGGSAFVRRHAWRSLLDSILLSVALFVGVVIAFCVFTLPTLLEAVRTSGASLTWADLWGALIRALAVWIVLAVIGLINTLHNIKQALQAWNGQAP